MLWRQDILTPHGFIHQPSPLWPLPPSDAERHLVPHSLDEPLEPGVSASSGKSRNRPARQDTGITLETQPSAFIRVKLSPDASRAVGLQDAESEDDQVQGCVAEIRSQIQLYATNE